VRVLNQRIPEVRFEETPLEQVMDWLRDFTELNISVRWQTLEDAGVRRDTPISIQARNLTLSQVLWLVMNEAAGSEVKLAYRASSSLLILSTEEDLSREMVTKVYDVSDLLLTLPRVPRQTTFNVTQGLGQTGSSGGGGAGGGMFGTGQQGQQGQYGQAENLGGQGGRTEIQRLVELIRDTVEPDTWRENGGMGTIIPYQNFIVVRNTILVHQRLGGYLTEEEVVGP